MKLLDYLDVLVLDNEIKIIRYVIENYRHIEDDESFLMRIGDLFAVKSSILTMKVLLEYCTDPSYLLLKTFISKNDLDLVKYAVSIGVNIEADDLEMAAETGNFEIFTYLIENSNIDIGDKNYLLGGAIMGNYVNIINYILEMDSTINISTANIILTIEENMLDVIKKYVEYGIDLTDFIFIEKSVGLIDNNIFNYLVSLSGNIHLQNRNLLIPAILSNKLEIVKIIIQNNDSICFENDDDPFIERIFPIANLIYDKKIFDFLTDLKQKSCK